MTSDNTEWVSIATRICSALKKAAALSKIRDTEAGKAGIHELYLYTFDEEKLVTHVTPQCIKSFGVFSEESRKKFVEQEVYERMARFVTSKPEDFNYTEGAGLEIGPLGKRPGELLTRIISHASGDVEILWEFVCKDGQCKVVDIVVLGASLSDQVKQSMQSKCHR